MRKAEVSWLVDGIRVRFEVRALPLIIRPEVGLLYGLGIVAVAVLGQAWLALLLSASGLLAWWATRHHTAELQITHDRLQLFAPLGRGLSLPLREIREIEVYDEGLELSLWGGRRLTVPAPAPGPQLAWIVARIRDLRDDAQCFALEMAEHESGRIKRLLHDRST